MAIVRDTNHTEKYVVIHNAALEDSTLSWDARGVLAYLLSRPDDWCPSMTHICKEGNIGRSKGKRIFRELREAGYLKKSQARTQAGRFDTGELICYETPREESEKLEKQHNNVVELEVFKTRPPVDRPTVIQPTVHSPLISKEVTSKELISKETPVIVENQGLQPSGSPNRKIQNTTKNEVPFNDFWKMWPKKVGLKAAEKAWSKIKNQPAVLALIATNLEMHANAGDWAEIQYAPNPATYLNGERWNDTVTPRAEPKPRHGGVADTLSIDF